MNTSKRVLVNGLTLLAPAEVESPNSATEVPTYGLTLKPRYDEAATAVAPASKPVFVDPIPDFPAELKSQRVWLVWKAEPKQGGRINKLPYNTAGARCNDRKQDVSFEEAATFLAAHNEFAGLGLHIPDGYICIDLDHSVAADGSVFDKPAAIFRQLDSYTEISPSETGLHIFVRGAKPGSKSRKGNIEIYSGDSLRFMTATGRHFHASPKQIYERDISAIYNEMAADSAPQVAVENTVVTKSNEINPGGKQITSKLQLLLTGKIVSSKPFVVEDEFNNSIEYPSQSECDEALCACLAFKYGGDFGKIDAEFQTSNLNRDKWKRSDYKKATIDSAIAFYKKSLAAAPRTATSDLEDVSDELPTIYRQEDAPEDEEEPIAAADELPDDKWFFKGRLLNFPNAALYGVTGDIIRKLHPQTESHPAGNLLDLLISLGSVIGRGPHYVMDGTRHACNEFGVRVGKSSKSRKGTGANHIRRILEMVDGGWSSRCNIGGLGSGEVMVYSIRDSQTTVDAKGRPQVDPGVYDKRLHIREGEFASVLVLLNKRDSRLSVNIRDAWDSQPLRNVTKGDGKQGCREPHVSLMADSTSADVTSMTLEKDKKNGCVNRFLWCLVERTKKLPHGGEDLDWLPETLRLISAVSKASAVSRVFMTANARRVWTRLYDKLSADIPGVLGAVTSRAEAHCLRIALLLALLDESAYETEKSEPINAGDPEVSEYHCHIDVCHLKAAFAFWEYCFDSARLIFGGVTDDQEKILAFLAAGPKSLSDIVQKLFYKHRRSAEVQSDLDRLIKLKKIALADALYKLPA